VHLAEVPGLSGLCEFFSFWLRISSFVGREGKGREGVVLVVGWRACSGGVLCVRFGLRRLRLARGGARFDTRSAFSLWLFLLVLAIVCGAMRSCD
jgi:hypothetical protein